MTGRDINKLFIAFNLKSDKGEKSTEGCLEGFCRVGWAEMKVHGPCGLPIGSFVPPQLPHIDGARDGCGKRIGIMIQLVV